MSETTPTAVAGTDPDILDPAHRTDRRRTVAVVGVLLGVAVLGFVLWRGSSMVFYVIMSWFVALAMEPAVARLTRWMPRAAATATVMLTALLAIGAFLWLFGSLLVDQLTALVSAVPGIASDVLEQVNRATGSQYTYDDLLEQAGISPSDLSGYAQSVAFGVFGFLTALLGAFFGIFVVAFLVFYISAGMPRLRLWLAGRMNPRVQVPFLTAWDLAKVKVGNYIAARVVLASLNAVASGVAFFLLDLPYWLPLALWTGLVAQFIPNIGTYVSIALPVVVGLTSPDPWLGVWVLVWGIAYQQVENLTIEPRISARAVDVHPAVSFGAALLGAQLFGLSGALMGVPLAATAMAMLEIYQRRYEITPETEERVAALVAPRVDPEEDEPELPALEEARRAAGQADVPERPSPR
ncbi:AI-2E family transporter [Phycicoccus sp. MAQZ13P-2]|uniref:AI-2E family transporter n=1 Tax=Phycicoccus mangrovi TaxID=2840470 RepID=UPI001C003D6F|nr:AI-2E family transporter [Phycicoccus mangrovi]MBT9256414.1 AI-2E family transporter [Phycicoccus mangrovi]MBT9275063.1 AI-2E family transporter [Phycicoccus mangrovi]